ncbi:MAG: hypothetical protein WDW38_007872 [Sanguina aurantia]
MAVAPCQDAQTTPRTIRLSQRQHGARQASSAAAASSTASSHSMSAALTVAGIRLAGATHVLRIFRDGNEPSGSGEPARMKNL